MGCCNSGEQEFIFVELAAFGNDQEDSDWARLGGLELEEALAKEWVKLVRADWLIERAKKGGALARRQDMPRGAYVGLQELKQAGAGVLEFPPGVAGEWLRVIVLSCPWLQPRHPDPHGENLRRIAEVLKLFVDDSLGYSNGGKPYGVFMDFTALFQEPWTEPQHTVFLRALPALNIFYSHPSTVVVKVTEFPQGYPNNPSFRYTLPEGANMATYGERGWCFAESAMSGLVKSDNKVLDVGRCTHHERLLFELIHNCKTGRNPPLHPDNLKDELDKKTFTSKGADLEKVARLYSAAFERRLSTAIELDYHQLGWGADAAQLLARALKGSSGLRTLNLDSNAIGGHGAVCIMEALQHSKSLALNLGNNGLEQWGAIAVAQALESNSALQTLELNDNCIGQQGAVALAFALQQNSTLQRLDLSNNCIGQQGTNALGHALQRNSALRTLDLFRNSAGPEGTAALGEALQSNRSLQQLDLEGNAVGDEGAVALGQALMKNWMLQSLNLGSNDIGDQGAAALAEAIWTNSSLQTLNLRGNDIGDTGAAALGKAFQSNRTLQALSLPSNRIGDDGAIAVAHAILGSSALRSLDLRGNSFGLEAGEALREAAAARPPPLDIDV